MMWLFIVIFAVLLAFGGVILRGAPYVPTLEPQARAALELLDLRPGQTLLELGSGDGKVLLVAARSGLNVIGIELNPILVVVSRLRTWRYRRQVQVIWGDLWRTEWPACDGVFTFLLGRFMPALRDSRAEIVVNLIENLVQYVARFWRHIGAREDVSRIFVAPNVIHLNADAQLVERGLEIQFFQVEAFYIKLVFGRNKDLVGGGRNVILPRAGTL